MNQQQQVLVRASFAKLTPQADAVAAGFYARLFESDPELRPLFKGDMSRQGMLLMTMIGTAVDNLHQLETILPAVRGLGQRHAAYGVKDADYDTVAGALLATLAQSLGSDFTPEVRDAWTTCYLTLAGAMKAAAAEVVGPRPADGHASPGSARAA